MKDVYDVLVAAGTTEAREAIECLQKIPVRVVVTVATALGAQVLNTLRDAGTQVLTGRKNTDAFEALIRKTKVRYVVDATHPFAVDVTKALKDACDRCLHDGMNVRYIRYIRETMRYDYERIIYVKDARAAAEKLQKIPGNFLLTTGANTVHIYKEMIENFNERGYVRVLNSRESREKCEACGLDALHVIAKNPPFSAADNMQCISKYKIQAMVSKDSGLAGGLTEKIESARAADIPLILIERPAQDNGISSKEELKRMIEMAERGMG